MLTLDFTTKGYIIMLLIWGMAGVMGAALAHKKSRSPFFWGTLCLVAPIALFAIGGMRAPGEPVPRMFRQDADDTAPASPAQEDTANGIDKVARN